MNLWRFSQQVGKLPKRKGGNNFGWFGKLATSGSAEFTLSFVEVLTTSGGLRKGDLGNVIQWKRQKSKFIYHLKNEFFVVDYACIFYLLG